MSNRLTEAIKRNLKNKAENQRSRNDALVELKNQETERQLAYDILREDPQLYERKVAREADLRRAPRRAPKQRVDEDLELQDYLEQHPEYLDKIVEGELKREKKKATKTAKSRILAIEDLADDIDETPRRGRRASEPARRRYADEEEEDEGDTPFTKLSLLDSPARGRIPLRKELTPAQQSLYDEVIAATKGSDLSLPERRALAVREALSKAVVYEEPPKVAKPKRIIVKIKK